MATRDGAHRDVIVDIDEAEAVVSDEGIVPGTVPAHSTASPTTQPADAVAQASQHAPEVASTQTPAPGSKPTHLLGSVAEQSSSRALAGGQSQKSLVTASADECSGGAAGASTLPQGSSLTDVHPKTVSLVRRATRKMRRRGQAGDKARRHEILSALQAETDRLLPEMSGSNRYAADSSSPRLDTKDGGETGGMSSPKSVNTATSALHFTEPVRFRSGPFVREFALMAAFPLSLPFAWLLCGREFLETRALWPTCRMSFWRQAMVSCLVTISVVLYVLQRHEGGAIPAAQCYHVVLLHLTWITILSFKYSLSRSSGKILSAQEWVSGERRTLVREMYTAEMLEGIDLSKLKCVFDPSDAEQVRERLYPALQAHPDLWVDEEEGSFPALLLVTRLVLSANRNTIAWECENLKVRHDKATFADRHEIPRRAAQLFALWSAVILPPLVRWAAVDFELNAAKVFGTTWQEWAFSVVAAAPVFVHVRLTLMLAIVSNLKTDILRRNAIAKAFSSMLVRLDGGAPDPRFPALDMLAPENLSAWFWSRRVASSLAMDMFRKVQLYASLVLFWIITGLVFSIVAALDGLQTDALVVILAAQYSVLMLGMVMSVVVAGGNVNNEGLRNALTLLRARVRVREHILRMAEQHDAATDNLQDPVMALPNSLQPESGSDVGHDQARLLDAYVRNGEREARSSAERPPTYTSSRTGLTEHLLSKRAIGASSNPSGMRRLKASLSHPSAQSLERSDLSGETDGAVAAASRRVSVTSEGAVDAGGDDAQGDTESYASSVQRQHEAQVARMLVSVLGLLDSVKDELQLFAQVRPLKLLGIQMGGPLVRALTSLLFASLGLMIRSLVVSDTSQQRKTL